MAVQTQIQVRRGTAATWTSTNPTLAAGEWGLETDTGKYKVGTGSAVWTSLGYASILPSTVTTKGDLLAATGNATVTRQAVGTDGSVLMADSNASTGVSYSPSFGFSAGKNKIINGDFGIWQRGTSFNTTGVFFGPDRWQTYSYSGSSATISQQTFTPGTAPVAGYEGTYFCRFSATNTIAQIATNLEDVRLLAGQTVTLSFWAKAASALTLTLQLNQNFGSGGSAQVTQSTTQSITTSWVRYSYTVALPSISGKTISTNSYLQVYFGTTTLSTNIDIWGVQLEAGSVATAFQTATGTIQGELAACQRYFYRYNANGTTGPLAVGSYYSTTTFITHVPMKQTMRTAPSATFNNKTNFTVYSNGSGRAATDMALDIACVDVYSINVTTSAATAGNAGAVNAVNANASIDFSSEL